MNLFTSYFSEEFVRAFAWTLIHSVWQGALIALVAAGVLFILKKHSPSLRYMILCILMLMIPATFTSTFFIYFNQSKTSPDPVKINSQIYNGKTTNLLASQFSPIEKTNWIATSSRIIESKANLLVLFWLTGFLLFLIRFSGSIFFIYRLKNKHLYQVELKWEQRLKQLSKQIALAKTVRLAESAIARVPMTIGYLKPVILLPLGTLSGVPVQQIDAILLHELAHILRKDYLINIMQSVIEMLFFYHPATWWISSLVREEREHICDDLAIRELNDQINYIKALTTMEELNLKSPLLANTMGGSKKKLLARVKRLVTPVKLRKGISEGIVAFLFILGIVFVFSFNALSGIPNAYDLSGRESGGKQFNLLPFNPSDPDTVKAVSKSGNVSISVFSDSVTDGQQKALQEMAESIDKKEGNLERKEERYVVHVNRKGEPAPLQWEEKEYKMIYVGDSTQWEGDSAIIIYNDEDKPDQYNNRIKIIRYNNDTIDTLIIIHPESGMNWEENENFQWNEEEMQDLMKDQQKAMIELQLSEEAMQDHMKDIQIEIEHEFPEGDFEGHEFYFEEPVLAPIPPMQEFEFDNRVPSAERIIRQELRDDGLTERGRKYVIEVDSKGMHINGEKQPKEVYKKYRKLVNSLENVPFEEGDTFKLIF